MKYLLSTIVALSTLWSPLAFPQGGSSQFRFMSFSIRDMPPTVQEVKDYRNGITNIQSFRDVWLTSEEHDARIKRYFRDMFGVNNQVFLFDDPYYLNETDEGVLYLDAKGECSFDQAVDVTPWWADSSVKVCPSIVTEDIKYTENNDVSGCTWGPVALTRDECGCGPNLITCLPRSMRKQQMDSIRDEFAERGLYAYRNNLSWQDLLGGTFFYGNRLLYQYYLFTEPMSRLELPSAAELAKLKSLPVDTLGRTDWAEDRIERAGVATMPGFLKQFNNYRSRIRALTNQLLCKDVDSSLNLDGIAQLKNPDFTAADRDHALKDGCDGCHYPMDNMGSTLFGWDDLGFYRYWEVTSQLGHVFGEEGTGPAFLMQGYVQRGTGFDECMAKTAWESFSGESWANLSEADKAGFASDSTGGPYTLIRSILLSENLFQLKTDGITVDPTSQSSAVLSFDDYINPILVESCSGSSCHSSDSRLGERYQYAYGEEAFAQAPVARISDRSMPPASSDKVISDANRQLLINFLSQ